MDFINVYSNNKPLKESLDYIDLKYGLEDDSELEPDINFSGSVSTENYVTAN